MLETLPPPSQLDEKYHNLKKEGLTHHEAVAYLHENYPELAIAAWIHWLDKEGRHA